MVQKKTKSGRMLFLITKTILVLWMISGGVSALLGAEFMVEQIEKLGYPNYFPKVLGIAKLIGALIFIFPVKKILKVITYCGVFFEVSIAFVSYIFAGLWQDSFPPIVFLTIATVSFFLWFKSKDLSLGLKPKLPKIKSFRPELITNKEFVKIYQTFQITEKHLLSLKQMIAENRIKPNQEVFNIKIGKEQIIITLWNLAYHHLAEGNLNKVPFLITFCPVCNSGMLFNRTVEDEILEFYVSGVYRGTMIMCDQQTNSYWDHITGVCLGGYYTGRQLEIIDSHTITSAKESLSYSDTIKVAIPQLSLLKRFFTKFQNGHVWRKVPEGKFYPGFKDSFEFEDTRRPEKELGLGILHKNKAKFYPFETIKKEKEIKDEFLGQTIIIKIDEQLGIPKAEFQSKSKEMPKQLFLRWYGFVQTFRNCEIY
ncbi:DUF3179 domain-containing (seleno)protein [Ulvibacterium sp.]|uniref:DUF3179 domain-containing (seleno)protein n=1 Tax=Ulvibacterium sp. TaxID=2665914 RepID=UPI002624919F|nr:DUF3179 domain-containing (seleno)protein [Ulvibacterium sp.]